MTSNKPAQEVLDHALNQFYSENDDIITITQLSHALNQLRANSSHNEWVKFINEIYPNHPLRDFIVQEPFTQHALFKYKDTRDSVLMDFIYSGDGSVPAPFTGYETTRGKRLHKGLMSLSTCQGIRNARKIIEEKIKNVSGRSKHARFLAIPSGHLREIPITETERQLDFRSVHALDLDEDALIHLQQQWGDTGLQTQQFNFLNLTEILNELQPLDFIWSNSLVNDLEDTRAIELIIQLFYRLRPNGELLIASLHPSHLLCGYLEVCCDWWPIYRDESQLLLLAEQLKKEDLGSVKTYREPTGTIVFLELVKRSR